MTEIWSKKKKILSRKERFRIPDEFNKSRKDKENSVENLLTQKEEEIQKQQTEEKVKYEKARKEYRVRYEKLKRNYEKFQHSKRTMDEMEIESKRKIVHEKYPEIKNLNRIIPWVNEKISEWRNRKSETNNLRKEVDECIKILNTLTVYIENPLHLNHLEYWYECKRNLRDELYYKLDCVTYKVIKHIEKEMTYLDLDITYYKESNEYFNILIWTVPDKPKTGKEDKFPLTCNFADVGTTVNLPKTFHCKPVVVRCLRILNDYFSEDCRTWNENYLPEEYECNFLKYITKNWERVEVIRMKQEEDITAELEKEKKLQLLNKIKYLIPSSSKENVMENLNTTNISEVSKTADDFDKTREISLSKLMHLKKTLSERIIEKEKDEVENIKKCFSKELETHECNMRKYSIIGGVYHLDLLKQPPQPKLMKDGAMLRMIIGDDNLQRWHYLETYEPPVKGGAVKHSTDDDDEDAENTPEGRLLSKLVLVTIKLPDHVLWFDAPIPVQWDKEKHHWSTEYIYEVKFNEEKQTLSFRTGKMTAFGLAVFKYNNFPYQNWKLKLDVKSSVPQIIFSLNTSALVLEFIIRKTGICLTQLENANTSALQQLVGVFYEPKLLVQLLKQGGVNVFPSQDACLYVDGVSKKHHITEDYLHRCMAFLCLCYEFAWSKWNLMAGYKKFVLQMQEIRSNKNNELVLVTDQKATTVECTDIGQSFTESSVLGTDFHPDLLTLAEEHCGSESKQIMSEMDPVFVETVYYFLSQVRVMSFC